MTKTGALHTFWSQFGLPAYPANQVPSDKAANEEDVVRLPFLTYTKGFSHEGYSSTVHLYYRTESEAIPDEKAEEICQRLRYGGVQIPCDGGQLWLTLENPEWYAAEDQDDHVMKHRIINVLITDYTL